MNCTYNYCANFQETLFGTLTSEFNSLKHFNTVLKEFYPVTYHMFEA